MRELPITQRRVLLRLLVRHALLAALAELLQFQAVLERLLIFA